MSNVIALDLPAVAPRVAAAVERFADDLCTAIDNVKEAGVPQGLVVSLLHAYALQQTQKLL